jgi:hypothetical protein
MVKDMVERKEEEEEGEALARRRIGCGRSWSLDGGSDACRDDDGVMM